MVYPTLIYFALSEMCHWIVYWGKCVVMLAPFHLSLLLNFVFCKKWQMQWVLQYEQDCEITFTMNEECFIEVLYLEIRKHFFEC
jgi:hypothetical protein